MNTTHIKVIHSDVEITYNEGENRWTFTLRGRDRSADSLAKAKEFIDKPLPPEKAKPFEKISAWFFRESPQRIEVTGIAEPRYMGAGETVWINQSGTRSKERVGGLIYPSNPKNDAIVEKIIMKEEEASAAKMAAYELKAKLSPLVLPKEE